MIAEAQLPALSQQEMNHFLYQNQMKMLQLLIDQQRNLQNQTDGSQIQGQQMPHGSSLGGESQSRQAPQSEEQLGQLHGKDADAAGEESAHEEARNEELLARNIDATNGDHILKSMVLDADQLARSTFSLQGADE